MPLTINKILFLSHFVPFKLVIEFKQRYKWLILGNINISLISKEDLTWDNIRIFGNWLNEQGIKKNPSDLVWTQDHLVFNKLAQLFFKLKFKGKIIHYLIYFKNNLVENFTKRGPLLKTLMENF